MDRRRGGMLAAAVLAAVPLLRGGERAVPELVRDLADPDCSVREAAFVRLATIVSADPEGGISGLPENPDDPEVARQVEALREHARRERFRRSAEVLAAGDAELMRAFEGILAEPSPAGLKELNKGLVRNAEHPFNRMAASTFASAYLRDRDP